MTEQDVSDLLRFVEYRDWIFRVNPRPDFFLQVVFRGGIGRLWKGRKWRLSAHMTRSEVIQTAFLAVLTAEEHEARERFFFKNQAIFGPHYDVDDLVAIAARVGNAGARA